MDCFVVSSPNSNKRAGSDINNSRSGKKPRPPSKQGNVSADIRVAEFGRHLFYADGGKLFCIPCNLVVDHHRKNTVAKWCLSLL